MYSLSKEFCVGILVFPWSTFADWTAIKNNIIELLRRSY